MIAPAVSETRSPSTDFDLWSDDVLSDPYPCYQQLRDLGPAVWLARHGLWAVARHSAARSALLDGETFTSTEGIAVNDAANNAAKGIMLTTDDPEHLRLRKVFLRPLMPAALNTLKERLNALAEARVDELLKKREFDAVSELAHYLPLTVVTELVGLSEEGKNKMLYWAAGLFNGMGPDGYERTLSGLEITKEAFGYLQNIKREELDPDGWGAALFEAADEGDITHGEARAMLMDYLGPALDTTINGLSSALWLMGRNPEQWDRLRVDPSLINAAIDEAMRLESPIRGFTRYITRDHDLEGVTLYKGDRALILYASANRDERRYEDPEKYDITRKSGDHIAFGYGTHVCAGRHLGKLEISTVLNILVQRVKRIHIVEEGRELHNTLRGLSKLIVRVEEA